MPSHAKRHPGPLPAPGILLGLIAACMMMQPLSTDLYLATLPHLATYFDASPALVQQTLSSFVIAFGTAQLVVGPLSDRFGRRPVLLAGYAIYCVASLACALAPTIVVLIAGRFVQALGACCAVLVARAVVRDAYTPEEGAHILAKASLILSAAPLLGPILGSWLQVAFGWRAAFFALTAYSVAAGFAAWRILGETNRHPDPHATHPAGLARNYGGILRSSMFWSYAIPGALSYGALFTFISGSSFVLIRVLGVPTQHYGFCFAFGVAGYLTGTMLCRRLLKRVGVQRALRIGATIAAVGGTTFAALAVAGLEHWTTVIGAMFVVLTAHGIVFPCVQAGAVAPFARQAGAASGLLGFVVMACAFPIGAWVGASHDGTIRPLAFTVAALCLALLASAIGLARFRGRIGASMA